MLGGGGGGIYEKQDTYYIMLCALSLNTLYCTVWIFSIFSNGAGVPRMVLQHLPRPHCGVLSSLQHSQILGA